MVKKAANRLWFLMGTSLILFLCVIVMFPMKAKAGYTTTDWPDEPTNRKFFNYRNDPEYENLRDFGITYDNTLDPDCCDCYTVINDDENQRWHYLITVQSDSKFDEIVFTRGSNYTFEDFFMKDKFPCKYDKTSKKYVYTYSITTSNVQCQCVLYNYSDTPQPYEICITREPEIVLDKTTISEITNTKSHTMTVKYAPVKKRLGYQIEYADNSKFNDKARVNTGAATKNIGKLTIGKYYYVRVRVYARYEDRTLVYSKWSGTRKIKIKK